MDDATRRRERLKELLELAQAYKGWSRKDLAKALGRDPTKLIPGSGIPKLDFVVDLAGVLDWSVSAIVACLWNEEAAPDGSLAGTNPDFEAIDQAARDAHRDGQYKNMIELAQQAYDAAETAEQRARACNREAGGWDGLGRYSQVLEVVQRGLRERPIAGDFRRMLQSNLANAYYTLWSLTEASAIAQGLMEYYEKNPPQNLRDQKTQAFAHYVAGHCLRRMVQQEPDDATAHAFKARLALDASRKQYEQLAREMHEDSYAGIAHTCRGGLLELDVELGHRDAIEALDEMVDALDAVVDVQQGPVGDWLESYGWWCIFGCNMALRHVTDDRTLQHYMAIFTNKADEIADALDNWAMRERSFTMQYTRWRRATEATGFEIPNVVDKDDVRLITGTMGRFPAFRNTGWQILKTAQVVRTN
jgi:hypothetical protein